MLTREDVMEKAKEERVKFLRLQFTDIFGALKNVAVTSEDLDRAISGKVAFDSSVVDGVVSQQERDIVLQPDPSSFLILPWRPREEAVARFICDVANPDGSPYPFLKLPRAFVDRLKALDAKTVKAGVKGALTGKEIEVLLHRRDLILEEIEALVREKGEAEVLY